MGWAGSLMLVCALVVHVHFDVMMSMAWLEDEKTALVHIKESLKLHDASMDATLLPSWLSDDPNSDSCKWERVTCDSSSGHVITLSLRDVTKNGGPFHCPLLISFNMSLFLPFHRLATLDLSYNCFYQLLGIEDGRNKSAFIMLESLDLSYNRYLNESIIKPLTSLTSLKNLNLAFCSIRGPFPIQELSVLRNLALLDLSSNYLSNPLSMVQDGKSNSMLTMLETLDLSQNYYLNESIIKALAALTSLKNLNLMACGIRGPFPIQELSVLQNLEALNLSYNSLSSPSSTAQDTYSLSKLMKLRTLNLNDNLLDKNIFKYLVALPALKSLLLSNNYLKGDGLLNDQGLCKMTQLEELDLSHNHLTGTLDPCLGNLTSLQALDLSSNFLSGSIPPSSVTPLVSLEYLSLSDNNFEGLFSLSSLANHSNLKMLSLGNENTKTFQVETENPPNWLPSFQLEFLQLSSCLPSSFPSFLLYQHSLIYVDLSKNNFVGVVPYWFFVNNSRLSNVFLNDNSFNELQLPSDHVNQTLDQLVLLKLSINKFQGRLPVNIGHLFPNLQYLDVSRNKFDGDIPASIGNMSKMDILDLSYNNFSGQIPQDIFLGCIYLSYLRLSNNSLQGDIFSTPMNLAYLDTFLADNNQFNGTLQDGLSLSLSILDISSNYLSGMLPSWAVKSKRWLSVSSNNFEGAIPMDLCANKNLRTLDLSHNRFLGAIPSCLFNSTLLQLIDLGSNNLTGTIPEILTRRSSIQSIDLSNNKFFGTIPESFYGLPQLAILSLANNRLEGELSSQICQLRQINILDLSRNKFSGFVPSCFNQMSFGNYSENLNYELYVTLKIGPYPHFQFKQKQIDVFGGQGEAQIVTKSLSLSYKGDNLRYMSQLDLSSNQLIGEIPHQIGELNALRALNLSHNHLNGTIPESFHNMIQMESLDLSSNKLTGEIPLQLQDLNFLSTFKVCYNNLSGRAPDQGQFANFDESSYKGNPFLSWSNSNPRIPTPPPPPQKSPLNDTEESESFIDLTAFYWSFGASYVLILLTLVTILWINPHWRNVWFYYISICLQMSFGPFFGDAFFYQD